MQISFISKVAYIRNVFENANYCKIKVQTCIIIHSVATDLDI